LTKSNDDVVIEESNFFEAGPKFLRAEKLQAIRFQHRAELADARIPQARYLLAARVLNL
jgi:hypothetical protein